MKYPNSIHLDETQPIEIPVSTEKNKMAMTQIEDDETVPILIFQHKIQTTPSWWKSAKAKAASKRKWIRWTWIVAFGTISFFGMWLYSVHFLNQQHRDVHLIIADADEFFDTAEGWATLSDTKGIRTKQGILFKDMAIGQHLMTVAFQDSSCLAIRKRFRLGIGDEVLSVPLKKWQCDKRS